MATSQERFPIVAFASSRSWVEKARREFFLHVSMHRGSGDRVLEPRGGARPEDQEDIEPVAAKSAKGGVDVSPDRRRARMIGPATTSACPLADCGGTSRGCGTGAPRRRYCTLHPSRRRATLADGSFAPESTSGEIVRPVRPSARAGDGRLGPGVFSRVGGWSTGGAAASSAVARGRRATLAASRTRSFPVSRTRARRAARVARSKSMTSAARRGPREGSRESSSTHRKSSSASDRTSSSAARVQASRPGRDTRRAPPRDQSLRARRSEKRPRLRNGSTSPFSARIAAGASSTRATVSMDQGPMPAPGRVRAPRPPRRESRRHRLPPRRRRPMSPAPALRDPMGASPALAPARMGSSSSGSPGGRFAEVKQRVCREPMNVFVVIRERPANRIEGVVPLRRAEGRDCFAAPSGSRREPRAPSRSRPIPSVDSAR